MSLIVLDKNFGQVFTPHNIADLLSAEVENYGLNFNNTLDMGAGVGALTKSLMKKNISKTYELIEIDSRLHQIMLNDRLLEKNILINSDINEFKFSNYDLIVSNPPFIQITANNKRELGDIKFLELMWNNLKEEGVFSIILTNNFVINSKYKKLRKNILLNTNELSIIELDSFVYSKTEVQSFIVTGKKSKFCDKNVLLKKANIYGEIEDELIISKEQALERMDITYYKMLKKLILPFNKDQPLLGDLIKKLTRGSKSNNYFKLNKIKAFHTTDFMKNNNKISFENMKVESNFKVLIPGDIVIPRVGTRCLSYNALIQNGVSYFTDCVYKISAEEKFQELIFNSISSPEGILWRQISSTGNCAKHLTISTLNKMPLFHNPNLTSVKCN